MKRFDTAFRVGDKVMQVQNNYTREVFNGDIGRVADIDPDDQLLTVRFDSRSVEYDFNELDELQLAYAISVHKSQGAEYPAVVIPRPHAALHDASAQPALHRDHARPQTRRPGRQPQGAVARGDEHGSARALFAVEVAVAE